MAELPPAELLFGGSCPDCGERRIDLPDPLPAVGDDFDWLVRDYDGFRLFMLEELAARFPERSRWTPADLEVALVEVLAAVLDQLSDMLDRVAGEAYLETARRPESVRRLLMMIGFDAVAQALARGTIAGDSTDGAEASRHLDRRWLANPHEMDAARRAGPRSIHVQHRMVSVSDYATRLEEHPLVERAHGWSEWTGSWTTIMVAIIGWSNLLLDATELEGGDPLVYPSELRDQVDLFHRERGLFLPALGDGPPLRSILGPYLESYRMAGQEVLLLDAVPVGISMSLSVRVAGNYFQSEVRRAVGEALGTGPGGFFEPGRLAFGEDLHASDVIQTLMGLDGVESVCLNRFKRIGSQFPDQSAAGRIVLEGLELAVCDNRPGEPDRGYYRLTLHGGLKG